jgi:hypothetical protein
LGTESEDSESQDAARLNRVDVVEVAAVKSPAAAVAAVPVGRADKRTLDCCCRIEVKGKLMGTTWERSIRSLLSAKASLSHGHSSSSHPSPITHHPSLRKTKNDVVLVFVILGMWHS